MDKLICKSNEHNVMYSARELVIQHPAICPRKGATLDRKKTFHPWEHTEEVLTLCDIQVSQKDLLQIQELSKRKKVY